MEQISTFEDITLREKYKHLERMFKVSYKLQIYLLFPFIYNILTLFLRISYI